MEEEQFVKPRPERRKPFILFRLWQWATAAFIAIIAIALLSDYDKAALPEAPYALYWATVVALIAGSIAHSSPVFFRLPGKAKLFAYLAIIPMFLLSAFTVGRLDVAYAKTPVGTKEAAARMVADAKQIETDRRQQEEQRLRNVEEEKLARHGKRQSFCESLMPQVKEILENKYSVDVIETNDIVASDEETHETPLTCTVEAITSSGKHIVAYSLERTPQGKVLVNVQILN